MSKYPKFEKVDANTIKITYEKANNVPLSTIMQNRKRFLEQKAQIEETLKNIDEVIENAKKLGIVPKEIPITKQDKNKPNLKLGETVK